MDGLRHVLLLSLHYFPLSCKLADHAQLLWCWAKREEIQQANGASCLLIPVGQIRRTISGVQGMHDLFQFKSSSGWAYVNLEKGVVIARLLFPPVSRFDGWLVSIACQSVTCFVCFCEQKVSWTTLKGVHCCYRFGDVVVTVLTRCMECMHHSCSAPCSATLP
jgi:hypothetical protein